MPTEYGVKVGKKIKVYKYAQGRTKNGSLWQKISFNDNSKDETGTYILMQRYVIWITNPQPLNLTDSDFVQINTIESVKFENVEYDGRRERVCHLSCNVSLSTYQRNNNGYQQQYNNGYQQPQQNPYANYNNPYPQFNEQQQPQQNQSYNNQQPQQNQSYNNQQPQQKQSQYNNELVDDSSLPF